eukprot:5731532-Pyramimonas_sp.AAC.1
MCGDTHPSGRPTQTTPSSTSIRAGGGPTYPSSSPTPARSREPTSSAINSASSASSSATNATQ